MLFGQWTQCNLCRETTKICESETVLTAHHMNIASLLFCASRDNPATLPSLMSTAVWSVPTCTSYVKFINKISLVVWFPPLHLYTKQQLILAHFKRSKQDNWCQRRHFLSFLPISTSIRQSQKYPSWQADMANIAKQVPVRLCSYQPAKRSKPWSLGWCLSWKAFMVTWAECSAQRRRQGVTSLVVGRAATISDLPEHLQGLVAAARSTGSSTQ